MKKDNFSNFRELEKKEDDILQRFDEINKEIKEIVRITTGLSSEFKELFIEKIIEALSTANHVNTWERNNKFW